MYYLDIFIAISFKTKSFNFSRTSIILLEILDNENVYKNLYFQEVNMKLIKCDEFDSLIRGIQFVDSMNPTECYYWANATDEAKCAKKGYDFSNPYPFLLVNIGSGVSVLAVYGPNDFKRISGTR